MNMSAAGTGASAAAVNPALAAMGRAYPAPAAAMRAYPVKAEPEQKQVTTEQIQDMLDENSKLIVDVITLNNQIKHGKGTAQLSEFTDKLDKKRKQLNANLMTLAKWADESSEQAAPRPVLSQQQLQQQQQHMYAQQQQQQQQQMQMQYPRAMAMNPMAGGAGMPGQAPMAMNQAQMQAQARYAQAQAYAQYQARLNSMGGVHPQYAQMGPAAVAAAQQQQRYHAMGYGNPAMQQQQQQQMPMVPPQMPPQMYDGGASQMGYQGWAPN